MNSHSLFAGEHLNRSYPQSISPQLPPRQSHLAQHQHAGVVSLGSKDGGGSVTQDNINMSCDSYYQQFDDNYQVMIIMINVLVFTMCIACNKVIAFVNMERVLQLTCRLPCIINRSVSSMLSKLHNRIGYTRLKSKLISMSQTQQVSRFFFLKNKAMIIQSLTICYKDASVHFFCTMNKRNVHAVAQMLYYL